MAVRSRRLAGVGLALAVLAVACSDGGGDQGATPSRTGSEGAAITDDTGSPSGDEGDVVWQVGTIADLSAGAYEGSVPVGELEHRGDLGLGTFDGLDGELVMVDGTVWQVPVDGVPVEPPPELTTPFAQVTVFEAERTFDVPAGTTCEDLPDWLTGQLGPDAGASLVALRFEGDLTDLTTRSVPAQVPPFAPLADVVEADQVTFALADASVVLVGFRTADDLESVSPPGVHLHGVTTDGAAGGHVLSCTVGAGTLAVDVAAGLELTFDG